MTGGYTHCLVTSLALSQLLVSPSLSLLVENLRPGFPGTYGSTSGQLVCSLWTEGELLQLRMTSCTSGGQGSALMPCARRARRCCQDPALKLSGVCHQPGD